ncbi:MAG: hypothetical protein K0R21_1244 [Anaerocolumna sp.]|jgi:uncharacterized membrane protein required for colicin V production|nr:hypothetical protein [Anaerocolumna sp.]
MNWLLGLVVIVIVGYTMNGRRRGFIKTVFTLFSTIIALAVTAWVSPVISKQVQNNEKIMTVVNDKVSGILDFNDIGSKTADEVSFIDKLPLPKVMKNTLIENNTKDVYVAMAVDNFEDYVSNTISRIIINASVFIILYAIATVGLFVLSRTLDIISKLPIINGLNKTAGLLAGFIHGIVIIWIGCIVLTALSSTKLGESMFLLINESPVLSSIYNNNLLLTFITNLGKTLF